MGNGTSAQADSVVNSSVYNNLNQLTSQKSGGKMQFEGTLSEVGTVTVQGKQADGAGTAAFGGAADVVAGLDTVPVVAKDYSNNSATVKYKVSVAGNGNKTLTYDANGNMLSDGTRSYEWDAENRLTAIVNGSLRSEFTYDGMSRRVRIVEKNGSTVTSDKRLLWDGNTIVAELNGAGNTVNKLYYVNGFTVSGSKYFYTRDHLGSIREVTDNSGTLQARYDYDPYGIRSKVAGTGQDADFSYAGHYLHQPSGMNFTKYRAYSAGLGRWLSRDPAGTDGGLNFYAYVGGNVPNLTDPLGLYADNDKNEDGRDDNTGDPVDDEGHITYPWEQIPPITPPPGGKGPTPPGEEPPSSSSSSSSTSGGNRGGAGCEGSGRRSGNNNAPRNNLPRGGGGEYLPDPDATGSNGHTRLGTSTSNKRNETYTVGSTFGGDGTFQGTTHVTNHGRPDHPNPHWHPATGPAGTGPAQTIPLD